MRELVADEAPQVFALVEEYGERVDGRIVAWGMNFDDHVEVVSVTSGLHISLSSPERAQRAFSRRRKIRLVWTAQPRSSVRAGELSPGVNAWRVCCGASSVWFARHNTSAIQR